MSLGEYNGTADVDGSNDVCDGAVVDGFSSLVIDAQADGDAYVFGGEYGGYQQVSFECDESVGEDDENVYQDGYQGLHQPQAGLTDFSGEKIMHDDGMAAVDMAVAALDADYERTINQPCLHFKSDETFSQDTETKFKLKTTSSEPPAVEDCEPTNSRDIVIGEQQAENIKKIAANFKLKDPPNWVQQLPIGK
mmetsp:Transcript_7926/g.14529  ORF Transcript_7926/g.14529 Transcript_7926/m.14529 type:complete len:193 (+) Transcript_7926:5994-6572(+)